jgi:hypothetical protein
MELSGVRCRSPRAPNAVRLEHMFLNGRYVRYLHIPDGVDIVAAVHERTKKQGKAQLSHRRASEVIRESVARRERMKLAQENAVRSVTGDELIPTEGRRLGEAADERLPSSALDYMDTSRTRHLTLEQRREARQQQEQQQQMKAAGDDGSGAAAESQSEKFRQAQAKANALGYVDRSMGACRDCKHPFTWTAAEQQFYHEKGFTNEPTRCKPCGKVKKERLEGAGGGGRGGGGGGGGGGGRS